MSTNGVFGFAYADLSTGEFRLTQLQDRQALLDELPAFRLRNFSSATSRKKNSAEIADAIGYDSYAFLPEQAAFTLCEHFKTKSLDGFGCGANAAGNGGRRRDRALFKTSASPQDRSSRVVAL